jgi:AbrB family looped-hinge helix DNA binding protein
LNSVKISAKGQVTLPRHARKALAVEPGDRLLVVVEDNAVSLRPLGPSRARDLAGCFRKYARKDPEPRVVRASVKKAVAHAAAHEG